MHDDSAQDVSPARNRRGWLAPALIGSAAALGITALYSAAKAREAEDRYPPIGRFITVNGVRLHYIERGEGEPLVLIHGNGTMAEDFLVSGIVDELAGLLPVSRTPCLGVKVKPEVLHAASQVRT